MKDWAAFREHEPEILAAIRREPYGAQRFLADPFRFLREVGLEASSGLREALIAVAPGLGQSDDKTYEEIVAGRHPVCKTAITITTLALPERLP
jgi:hypothetical protein